MGFHLHKVPIARNVVRLGIIAKNRSLLPDWMHNSFH